MINKAQRTPIWNFPFIFLTFCATINAVGFYMINPLLSGYIVSMGFDLSIAGIIVGLFSATALIARPVSGMLADSYNKKRLMAGCFILTGLSVFGYFFAQSSEMLCVIRIFHGLSFGMCSTINISLAAEFIPEDRMGEGLGYLSVSNIVAAAVGPNIGVILEKSIGIKNLFLIVTASLGIGAVLFLFLPYKHTKQKCNSAPFCVKNLISPKVLPYAGLTAVITFSAGTVNSFLMIVGENRDIENISLYFSMNAIVLLIVRFVFGKYLDRIPICIVICGALLFSSIETFMLGRTSMLWVILMASVIKAVGQGAAQPALQSACIKKLGIDQSGIAVSTYYVGADIGQGLGPIVSGSISAHFGYTAMFYFCSILCAGTALIVWFISKRQKN